MTWHTQAACRGMGPDLFYATGDPGRPNKGKAAPDPAAPAKAICATCPVKQECGEAGKDEHGVWGGVDNDRAERGHCLVCRWCGNEFWNLYGHGRYCSDACRDARTLEVKRRWQQETPHICETCGTSFSYHGGLWRHRPKCPQRKAA